MGQMPRFEFHERVQSGELLTVGSVQKHKGQQHALLRHGAFSVSLVFLMGYLFSVNQYYFMKILYS